MTPDKSRLLARIEASLRVSGWQTIWLNSEHPAKARFVNGGTIYDAWVHIWNLTPGGRQQSRPLERRIQPTGIGDYFRHSAGANTLILGWSDEVEVFAAFDFRFHSSKLGSSPSIQTDLTALENADQNGLGVFAKATGELSIAVRADMLSIYLEHQRTLHESGEDEELLDALRQMAGDPLLISPSDLPAKRRKKMVQALRALRDRRFSRNVLQAYGHKCAFCGVQLNLLDAAHILPVAHPDSTDVVPNGIALCALHHRAYDRALVTFDKSYSVEMSAEMLAQLSNDGRDGGLAAFQSTLSPKLILPASNADHPSHTMIEEANRVRGWQ